MGNKTAKRLSQYKDNPDEWVKENIGQIIAWAQSTYKTTYEKEDMMQSAHLSVIMATAVVAEKNLKDQKSFRAAFFYCLRNNRPVGFYDTPFSAIGEGFTVPIHTYEMEPNLAASSITSTLMDVLEVIWPQTIAKMSKTDREILTPILGLGDHGQLSCREAAAILGTPKSTVSRRTITALQRLREHIVKAIPELHQP